MCDGCGAVDIEGIRHKCHLCYNYNLCDQCYRAQRETKHHKAAHPMEDITPGGKPGRAQPQRDSPVGKYIRRGRDWKWGDQGHDTQGTCVGLKDQWVSVRWDDGTRNNYRWGSGGAYDVFIVGPAEAKDLVGCRVRRGPDWKWGDQDGNADGFIEAQPQEGVALVRWRNSGLAFQYRWGIEGAYDLVVIGEKEKDGTATATATSTPGTSTAGAGSSSSGSGSGGDDDDGIEAVELSDEEAVDILWKCTIMLRASLKSSVLKGVPGLAKPSSLADVYNKVYNLEQAIRFNNFTQAWREHKYDYWNKQMRSSTATTRHIASCLLEFEVNVLPSAQEDAWKDARKQWCAVLFIIGGRPFNYPTPTGRSSYDPCAGGSGKTSGSSGGGSSDLQNIVSQCKTQ